MVRLVLVLAALVVGVLVFFPDEVATAQLYASQMIEQMAIAAAGYYGAAAR